MTRVLAFVCLVLGLALPALAEERSAFWPQVPVATGEAHPQGNEAMRKQHMEMMKHDRDSTMYEGDRDVKASLSECFECHAVKDDRGTPVTYADDKHFCRVCHDFAAVKVDCFMCHRSTPDGVEEPSAHALAPQEPMSRSRLQAYLDSIRSDAPVLAQSTEVVE